MSSPWSVLETTPDLLERFSQSLFSVEDLTQSLEQKGLISGGDIVDHVQITSPVGEVTDIRELVKRIVIKDEDSYCSFKRTLIENGEYDALEVLSSVSLPHCHQLQQPQDQPSETHPQTTVHEQMPPRDQSECLSTSMQRSACVSTSDSELSTKQGTSSQEEEVDAKPAMGAASTSTAAAAANVTSMVTVTRAEKITVGPRIYKLTESPRGLCVIFNNRTFLCGGKDRPGSELDVQRMSMLFEEFKFMVFTHEDQSSHEMMSLLDTYANQTVLEGHQAFVLILMSHGELNHIYGSDYNQVKLQSIFEKFNNFNCPALRERPKMFFIQACRGDHIDNGTPGRDPIAECFEDDGVQSDAGMFGGRSYRGSGDAERQQERRISYWSDMYIAYAVIEGYESLRDFKTGSWFMKAVFDVMARHAHKDDLDTLMDSVSQRVLEKQRGDGQKQCPEVKKIGWRKKLYFNPGLSE